MTFPVTVAASPPVGADPTGDVELFIVDGESNIPAGTQPIVGGSVVFSGLTFPIYAGEITLMSPLHPAR